MMRVVATKRFRFRGGWAVPGDIVEVPRRRGAFLTRLGLAFNLDVGDVALGVGGGGPGSGGVPEIIGARSDETLAAMAATDWDLELPIGVQEGDLLVTFVCIAGNRTISAAPTGWVSLALFASGSSTSDARFEVWTKVAGSSEPSSYTWIPSASGMDITSCLVALRVDDGTPTIPVGGFSTAVVSTETEPDITVPEVTMPDDGLLLGAFASFRISNPRIMTNPEGMTSRYTNPVNRNAALRVSDQVVEAGPTGSRTSAKTPFASAGMAGILIQVVGGETSQGDGGGSGGAGGEMSDTLEYTFGYNAWKEFPIDPVITVDDEVDWGPVADYTVVAGDLVDVTGPESDLMFPTSLIFLVSGQRTADGQGSNRQIHFRYRVNSGSWTELTGGVAPGEGFYWKFGFLFPFVEVDDFVEVEARCVIADTEYEIDYFAVLNTLMFFPQTVDGLPVLFGGDDAASPTLVVPDLPTGSPSLGGTWTVSNSSNWNWLSRDQTGLGSILSQNNWGISGDVDEQVGIVPTFYGTTMKLGSGGQGHATNRAVRTHSRITEWNVRYMPIIGYDEEEE